MDHEAKPANVFVLLFQFVLGFALSWIVLIAGGILLNILWPFLQDSAFEQRLLPFTVFAWAVFIATLVFVLKKKPRGGLQMGFACGVGVFCLLFSLCALELQ